MEMLKAGAKGYLIKNADKDEVITAIKVVNAGHKYYWKSTTDKMAKMVADGFDSLRKKPLPEFVQKR